MATQRDDRPTTTEVEQFRHFTREGDIIPHGWNKHIGTHSKGNKSAWRSRPFAERLLARIVWFYTPTPIKNESGDVIAWQRKFKADYWQINFNDMAASLGCSSRTIKDELAMLVELGLVRTQASRARNSSDGNKSIPLHVIPIHAAIVKITGTLPAQKPVKNLHQSNAKAGEETSLGAGEESSSGPVKNLHPSSSSFTLMPDTSIKIAANAADGPDPAQIETEPEGDTQNGTSSPLQQSPTHDDVPPALPKNPPATKANKAPRARNVMMDKIMALTHTTPAMAASQVAGLIKKLKADSYNETHIDLFEMWWCQDWRSADKQGNRGIVPTVGQIGQLFGVAMAWADKHAPKAPIVETLTPEQEAELEAKLIAEYKAREDELDRRREAAGWAK